MDQKEKDKKKKKPGFITRGLMTKRLKTYVPGPVDASLQMEAAMKVSSKFVVMKHQALRAGLHYDLRFKMPKSRLWISFAIRKGIPDGTEKRLAVRTHDHTEKEALFTGSIKPPEYGAGKLTKFDSGSCTVLKFDPPVSMTVEFKGSKLKGVYHFVNQGVSKKDFRAQSYWFFKGKQLEEALELIKYTPEDLEDFQAIGAVIVEDKKILMMDHVKFNFWTVPIGKVKKKQSVEEGLIEELQEELGITPTKFRRLTIWKKTFKWRGKVIKTENHLFFIDKYRGKIKNNEPNKHRSIKFIDIKGIKRLRLSEMTKQMVKLLDKGKLKIGG